MGANAADPTHYSIVQENVNPEAGSLAVLEAKFTDSGKQKVELKTRAQNEVTYRVRVSGVNDATGQPLEGAQPYGVDPTSATFAGRPPSGTATDTDGDGLSDDEEQFGDGLDDKTEKSLATDPPDEDTDDDTLTDSAEFNEASASRRIRTPTAIRSPTDSR